MAHAFKFVLHVIYDGLRQAMSVGDTSRKNRTYVMKPSQYIDQTVRVIRTEAVLASAHVHVTENGAALAGGLGRRHCPRPLALNAAMTSGRVTDFGMPGPDVAELRLRGDRESAKADPRARE